MKERIKRIMSIVFKIPKNEIYEDSSPDNIENWDSLSHMKLVLALEEEFNVKFRDEEIIEIQNFKLIELVLQNLLKSA